MPRLCAAGLSVRGTNAPRTYGIISVGAAPTLRPSLEIMLPNLQINNIVRMRKPHPCGGYEWKVTRLGADIGLECLTCGHRVMLTRRELARRAKTILNSELGTSPGDKHANSE